MDSLGKTRTHCEFVLPEILELLGIFQRILWISHPPDAGADKLPSLSLSKGNSGCRGDARTRGGPVLFELGC